MQPACSPIWPVTDQRLGLFASQRGRHHDQDEDHHVEDEDLQDDHDEDEDHHDVNIEMCLMISIEIIFRSFVLDRMVRAINRWDISSSRNINYRSFAPIIR